MTTFALLLLLACFFKAQPQVFDISKYRATPNGNITQLSSYSCTISFDRIIRVPQDPSHLNGDAQWVKFTYVNFFTLSGRGTFDGQGAIAWIKIFHVNVLGCNNITFTNFNIIAPATSLNRNEIHIGRSTQVNITNTNIAIGDDCISLGNGNGVRIKIWHGTPGTTTMIDMHFKDIKMVNVMNPIIIDKEYFNKHGYFGSSIISPKKIKIRKVTFKNIIGTSATQEGVVLVCSNDVPCEDVVLSDIDLKFNGIIATAKLANVKPTTQGKSLPRLNLA
ncbi:Polygalacturonase [Glycine soja]|uniref:Polygalacturonase n=1 Tax=Glycine soja TaxID=3848 RepID=A0A445FSR3_GLYSO|nr:hypothetical protein JHK86_050123 [Glycine max]KAG4924410.1 hypothetical protein JHK87_049950 [Glycine soja]RZB51950.1 Polygalacturonase [Glycine soja]